MLDHPVQRIVAPVELMPRHYYDVGENDAIEPTHNRLMVRP